VQAAQRAVAVGIGYPQFGQFIRTRHGDINLPLPRAGEASHEHPAQSGQLIPKVRK
jgi:hypothetical protein